MSAGSIRLRRRAGFSLVEVLIAMGLLSAVLVAIASMFVLGQSSEQRR